MIGEERSGRRGRFKHQYEAANVKRWLSFNYFENNEWENGISSSHSFQVSLVICSVRLFRFSKYSSSVVLTFI